MIKLSPELQSVYDSIIERSEKKAKELGYNSFEDYSKNENLKE